MNLDGILKVYVLPVYNHCMHSSFGIPQDDEEKRKTSELGWYCCLDPRLISKNVLGFKIFYFMAFEF